MRHYREQRELRPRHRDCRTDRGWRPRRRDPDTASTTTRWSAATTSSTTRHRPRRYEDCRGRRGITSPATCSSTSRASAPARSGSSASASDVIQHNTVVGAARTSSDLDTTARSDRSTGVIVTTTTRRSRSRTGRRSARRSPDDRLQHVLLSVRGQRTATGNRRDPDVRGRRTPIGLCRVRARGWFGGENAASDGDRHRGEPLDGDRQANAGTAADDAGQARHRRRDVSDDRVGRLHRRFRSAGGRSGATLSSVSGGGLSWNVAVQAGSTGINVAAGIAWRSSPVRGRQADHAHRELLR